MREGSSGVYGVTESLLDVGVGAPAAAAPAPAKVQGTVVRGGETFTAAVMRQQSRQLKWRRLVGDT